MPHAFPLEVGESKGAARQYIPELPLFEQSVFLKAGVDLLLEVVARVLEKGQHLVSHALFRVVAGCNLVLEEREQMIVA